MKKLTILLPALLFALSASAQKLPDTSKRPVVYWSELVRLRNLNNELTRRIHKLDMKALSRDTMDMLSSEIGYLTPMVYKRVYPDTVKKGAGK
jgi:hypothetical protein